MSISRAKGLNINAETKNNIYEDCMVDDLIITLNPVKPNDLVDSDTI